MVGRRDDLVLHGEVHVPVEEWAAGVGRGEPWPRVVLEVNIIITKWLKQRQSSDLLKLARGRASY